MITACRGHDSRFLGESVTLASVQDKVELDEGGPPDIKFWIPHAKHALTDIYMGMETQESHIMKI